MNGSGHGHRPRLGLGHPAYMTQQSAAVLLGRSRSSRPRVSAAFLESINMVLDELLWRLISKLARPESAQDDAHADAESDPDRSIGSSPTESVFVPITNSVLKTKGIQQVLPTKLARNAIIEAELALIAYNSRHGMPSSASLTPSRMSPVELFEQVQIDCQILLANPLSRPIARPSPTQRNPLGNSQSLNDLPTLPDSSLDRSIPLLFDHSRFEVLLHAHYHSRNQAWFSHPARQQNNQLARTIIDHRSIIYLLAFIQSLASYLIKGSFDLLQPDNSHLCLLPAHLLQFIAQDEPMTGFWMVFDKLDAKLRIEAIPEPRLSSSSSSTTDSSIDYQHDSSKSDLSSPIHSNILPNHQIPPDPDPDPDAHRWRDNIQPSWLNINPVTSPPAPFSLSLKRDHSPRRSAALRSASSKNKSSHPSPVQPHRSLNSISSPLSPHSISTPVLASPALLPRARTSSKKVLISRSSSRHPAQHTPPARSVSSHAHAHSPRERELDLGVQSDAERELSRLTQPGPFGTPISPPVARHLVNPSPHSAPVPFERELIYNHQDLSMSEGHGAGVGEPRKRAGHPLTDAESRSVSSASSASSASIISAPTTTSQVMPDWKAYPAHAHRVALVDPANRSRSGSTSSARPGNRSVGEENMAGSLNYAQTATHSGSSTSSPYQSSGDRPLLSPPPPTHLSFEELMLSNETMKVSLTPGQCLESDSAMMSRQSSTSSELPMQSTTTRHPSSTAPPVVRLQPRTEPSPQHVRETSENDQLDYYFNKSGDSFALQNQNHSAGPRPGGSVNELVARNQQAKSPSLPAIGLGMHRQVHYEPEEESEDDSDMDEFQAARSKRKSKQLQSLAEILGSEPPWAVEEEKARLRAAQAQAPAQAQSLSKGKLGSAGAFLKKKSSNIDGRSGKHGSATSPNPLGMFGRASTEARSARHDRAGPSSEPMDEYMTGSKSSQARRLVRRSPSPSGGSLDLRKFSASSDSDHVTEPFSPGLSAASDEAPEGSGKAPKKTRGFKSIIARLKGKDDQDGSLASLHRSRGSKSDQSSFTHEGARSLASSSMESMNLGVRNRGLLTKNGVLHNPHSPAIGSPPEPPPAVLPQAPAGVEVASQELMSPRRAHPPVRHEGRHGGSQVTRGRTVSSVSRQVNIAGVGARGQAGHMPVSVGVRPAFMSFVVAEPGQEGGPPSMARTLPLRRSSSMKAMAQRPVAPPLGPLLDVVGYGRLPEGGDGRRREAKIRTLTAESNSSEASGHTITRFDGHHQQRGSPIVSRGGPTMVGEATQIQVGRIVDDYDKGAEDFSVGRDMAARRVAYESYGAPVNVREESAAVYGGCEGQEEEEGGEEEEELEEEAQGAEEEYEDEDEYGRRNSESVVLGEVYQIAVAREVRPAMVSRMVLGSASSGGSNGVLQAQQDGGWVGVEEVRELLGRVSDKVERMLRQVESHAPGSRGTFGAPCEVAEGGSGPDDGEARGEDKGGRDWQRVEKRQLVRIFEEELEQLRRRR